MMILRRRRILRKSFMVMFGFMDAVSGRGQGGMTRADDVPTVLRRLHHFAHKLVRQKVKRSAQKPVQSVSGDRLLLLSAKGPSSASDGLRRGNQRIKGRPRLCGSRHKGNASTNCRNAPPANELLWPLPNDGSAAWMHCPGGQTAPPTARSNSLPRHVVSIIRRGVGARPHAPPRAGSGSAPGDRTRNPAQSQPASQHPARHH